MRRQIFDPIAAALREDIGKGDITSQALVPAGKQIAAKIIARGPAIVAGTKTAAEVFCRVDPKLKIRIVSPDGSPVGTGKTIIELRGSARSILTVERVALNFLQHLSGIATLTRKFVEAAGTRVKILDTRKTTPGLRKLEKAAVVTGGGWNHRFGLFDMVLVKDNHLVAGSGLSEIAKAIRRVRQRNPRIRIEVEADHLDQVRALLKIADVDLILLDNMTPAQVSKAIGLRKKLLRGQDVKFEASGGITLRNVRQIAATGVDYISVGALTHSAPAINLSLEITNVAP
jgi:nicotinate-nucleotide pyrophosphorylase (carboxylating)